MRIFDEFLLPTNSVRNKFLRKLNYIDLRMKYIKAPFWNCTKRAIKEHCQYYKKIPRISVFEKKFVQLTGSKWRKDEVPFLEFIFRESKIVIYIRRKTRWKKCWKWKMKKVSRKGNPERGKCETVKKEE